MILALQGWIEWRARTMQVRDSKASLINLASSLAQHAEDTIEIADTAVVGVVKDLEITASLPDNLAGLSQRLAAQVAVAKRFQDIIVIGADGIQVAASAAIGTTDFSDRDYFRHHRNVPDVEAFIGPPVRSRVSGKWIMTVSRRFRSADGGFGGVVAASIDLSTFSNHYATFDLGSGSSIALLTTGGTLLVRSPPNDLFIGKDISKTTVFTDLRDHAVGSYRTVSFIDGLRRFSGYCRSNRYPLIVVASMAEDEVLAGWLASMRIHMLIAVVLIGAVTWLGYSLIRQLRRSQGAEQALRKSEELLDHTGRLAGVGGWEVNLVTNEIYWSAETYRIHGVEPSYKPTLAEAINFYAPEARPVVAAAVERCKADGDGWDLELPFNRADGRQLWVRAVGFVTYANGVPVRATGAFQDVTERVAERQALQRANERLTLATDSGSIGIWDWDVTNDSLVWDPWMYRIYGTEPTTTVGAYELWQRYLHPDDRESAEKAVLEAVEGSRPYTDEFRIVWTDGSVHHLRSSGQATRDAAGGVTRVVGTNRDVTAQWIEEEQRSIIIEAAPNGMMIVDEAGIITLANSQVERIFDYAPGTLVGQPVEVLVPEEFRSSHGALRSAFTGAQDARTMAPGRQIFGRKRDGSQVTIEIMLSPVRTPQGAIVIASLIDVTERMRQIAERQETERRERLEIEAVNANLDNLSRHLAKARDRAEQANRAKTRFLAGMSHELRTPLNGILGYAQLLHLDGGLNPTQASRVDAMLAAGKHLLQMINCVLDLSEIESEHVELQAVAFGVRAVVEACVDLIRPAAETKGLTVSIAVASGMQQTLIADPVRLRQVLLNLLGNAAKFTKQGTIEVRLRNSADGTALRIEVTDTGVGIPAEQRQRLFQDFERLDTEASRMAEGAGLGLALSGRLASLMGGRLGHADNPSGGSVFWLEVPWEGQVGIPLASPALADQPDDRCVLSPNRVLQVLVVDDAAMNRDIAGSFLTAAGHKAMFAEGGAEAVAAVQGTDFDVVLMDVRMPEVDGLEATRRIRALPGACRRVPIVALTAQAFTDQVEACRQAGMDSHLAKPFDIEALLSVVAHAAMIRQRDVPAEVAADVVAVVDQRLAVLDVAVHGIRSGDARH